MPWVWLYFCCLRCEGVLTLTRGVCAVGGLVCNQFLHTLSLSQNSFDKKCAELLAQCLVHNETLTNLDLRTNDIKV